MTFERGGVENRSQRRQQPGSRNKLNATLIKKGPVENSTPLPAAKQPCSEQVESSPGDALMKDITTAWESFQNSVAKPLEKQGRVAASALKDAATNIVQKLDSAFAEILEPETKAGCNPTVEQEVDVSATKGSRNRNKENACEGAMQLGNLRLSSKRGPNTGFGEGFESNTGTTASRPSPFTAAACDKERTASVQHQSDCTPRQNCSSRPEERDPQSVAGRDREVDDSHDQVVLQLQALVREKAALQLETHRLAHENAALKELLLYIEGNGTLCTHCALHSSPQPLEAACDVEEQDTSSECYSDDYDSA